MLLNNDFHHLRNGDIIVRNSPVDLLATAAKARRKKKFFYKILSKINFII